MEIVPANNAKRWQDILDRIGQYDTYHLASYHSLAMATDEGNGYLFCHAEGDCIVACPFLVRSVDSIPGLEQVGAGWKDATSVYGYPGPIVSQAARNNSAFLARFEELLLATAKELKLVTMFSRLNPIFENHQHTQGLGEIAGLGETVWIDLMETAENQWKGYRESHRYEILKAQKQGLRVCWGFDSQSVESFYRLYIQTMRRAQAKPYYFFPRAYFEQLKDALGEQLLLGCAEFQGTICSGALFLLTGKVMQYHLSGSDPGFGKLAPAKVVLDEARLLGKARGAKVLHLGGGVGSSEDNLFKFKAGFSPLRSKYYVWKCIVEPEMYMTLVQARRNESGNSESDATHNFFPLYRSEV